MDKEKKKKTYNSPSSRAETPSRSVYIRTVTGFPRYRRSLIEDQSGWRLKKDLNDGSLLSTLSRPPA